MLRVLMAAALVLTTLFATATIGLSREWEETPIDGGWQIVFTAYASQEAGYIGYIMNWDGSDVQPLTWGGKPIAVPACSPDGGHLGFHGIPDSLYVVSANGSEFLHSYFGVSSEFATLSVSNDGKAVLFTGTLSRGDYAEIQTLMLRSDMAPSATVIPPNGVPGGTVLMELSPDGSRIALQSNLGNISILNTDLMEVTEIATNAAQPVWSPDGSMIALMSYWRGEYSISITDINRRLMVHLAHLTTDPVGRIRLSWSPDGQWIVFSHIPDIDDPDPDYYVMVTNGSEQHILDYPWMESFCLLTGRPLSLRVNP